MNTIKEWFGEIPQGVDYQKHILDVLKQIASEDGFYFTQRQDVNRKIRFKKQLIEETQKELPENFNADKWENYDLQAIHTQIEQARQHNAQIEKAENLKANYDNKVRGFQATREVKLADLKQQLQEEKTTLEAKRAELVAELKATEENLFNLNGKFYDKEKVVKAEYEATVAPFNEELKAFEPFLQQPKTNILPMQEEAETALKMKQLLPQYNKMLAMNNELAEFK